MSLERVTLIRTVENGESTCGSGYLVAPGLVLTAAHLVPARPTGGRVAVEQPHRGAEPLPAEVVWRRYDDDVDAALLTVPRGTAVQPPVRWGELVTELPDREADTAGFPRMQRTPGARYLEQARGRVHPGTGLPGRRYEILVDTAPVWTGEEPPGTTPWSGMSGAAVFHKELLIGVVRRDRRPDGGSRLTATRAVDLLDDPGFRTAVHAATGVRPLPEPAEVARLLTPPAPRDDDRSPAMLLRADAEVVPFHGREREQAELVRWCEEDGPPVSALILAGAGGQGKSRLARWLVTRMTERGWVAGQLDRPGGMGEPSVADLSVLPSVRRELLLVVDYAEGRPQELREFLRIVYRRSLSTPKVRLLLVARAPGAWNKDPMRADAQVRSTLSEAPVIELGHVAAPARGRRETFRTAVEHFARRLDLMTAMQPPADAHGAPTRWAEVARRLPVPGTLGEDRYGNPLDLQMAALTALLDRGTGHATGASGAPLEERLLDHEATYWDWTAPTYRVDLSGEKLKRAVAAATLCGAADRGEALRTVTRVPELPTAQRSEIALLLHKLYPPPPERFWGRLQPDRVAEFLAWQAVEEHEEFLGAMLSGATAAQQEQLLIDLVRAALGHERAGRIQEGTRLLLRIETVANEVGELHADALRGCYSALPDWDSPPLLRFARWLTGRLVTAFEDRAVPRDPAERRQHTADLAWAWHQHWSWSRGPENPGGERAWILTAVMLRRTLAEADPAAHLPALASSLYGLGYHYSKQGDDDAALTAERECVNIVEGLARAAPRAHEAWLASALHNLSITCRDKGYSRTADFALEEAVKIRARLMEPAPDRHRHDFARTLAVLADAHGRQGRRRLAVAAAQGAVLHYRQAAAQDPVWGRPLLAWALGVAARYRAQVPDARDRSDAIVQAEEAAAIQRLRARHYPETFGTDYAWALDDLITGCLTVQQPARALPHAREAILVWQSLAEADPARAGNLAEAWQTLAEVYRSLGDRGRALAAIRRAVDLYRRLPDASADHRHQLAHHLWTWAYICLDTADARHAAHLVAGIRPARESLAILRRLHGGRHRYPDGSPFGAAGTLHELERRLGRVPSRARDDWR
ncbi:trypsin-like peptidase domain-containing protein [Streptomyces lancefieldiae]|uniref:Trypsin-like peptidase domain-containing protein n=1 Tax=Streptomyces lancefieldiae TaxID=3075520 RepID=A0ABU3AQD2_9ACTN|nr:trypsin-like peptidase domain-containing protein [Streptomyces sp. DSM 40712]MDT0612030.1 trypsin-like peptidase domain-containing protein [Streptomyces sp. DSM 40712]